MREFDVKKTTEDIIKWIQTWFDKNGKEAKAVIGISGGKDSSIVAALLVQALGRDRVIGVLMPNGEQADIKDSLELVAHLDLKYRIVNIKDSVDAVYKQLEEAGVEITEDIKINTPPRIRMTTLYAVAQSFKEGGRVANTCNKSEDYVGFSTKFGDAASDFAPTADLTVRQILEIGDYLKLPYHLVHKTPSDGLCGKSDEEKFGFTYKILDHYIETGECEDDVIKEKIDRMHFANLHKLQPMPTFRLIEE